jgi:hypothetical protein
VVDLEVAAFAPPQLRQTLPQRTDAGLSFRIGFGRTQQHPEPSHRPALLRAPGERPRRRAAEQCDEVAAFHWLTLKGKDDNQLYQVMGRITAESGQPCQVGVNRA